MIRVFAKVITFSQNWRDEFILKLRKMQFVLGLIILLIVSGISLLVSGTAGMTVSFGVFSLGILPSLTGFYIKEDNLLGLLTSMFAICGIFYIQTKKPLWCLLASIFAVLSASAKYPGFLNVVLIVSIILIVYPSLGGQRKKHIVFILLGLAFGFGILLLFLPELMLFHDKVTDGLEYEVRRGLLSHFGFKIPAIDFFGLFLFWKTFFEYENIFFGSIAVISLQFAIKQIKDKKILFLLIGFFIYYAVFEFSSGKPVPQYHRYLFPAYIFLIPLMSLFLVTVIKKTPLFGTLLLLLTTSPNLLSLKEMTNWVESTEFKFKKFQNTVFKSCPAKSKCFVFMNKIPQHLSDINHKNHKAFFVITDLDKARYLEARLSKKRVKELNETVFIMQKLELIKTFETKYGLKPFMNPTYYVFLIKDLRRLFFDWKKWNSLMRQAT